MRAHSQFTAKLLNKSKVLMFLQLQVTTQRAGMRRSYEDDSVLASNDNKEAKRQKLMNASESISEGTANQQVVSYFIIIERC